MLEVLVLSNSQKYTCNFLNLGNRDIWQKLIVINKYIIIEI